MTYEEAEEKASRWVYIGLSRGGVEAEYTKIGYKRILKSRGAMERKIIVHYAKEGSK